MLHNKIVLLFLLVFAFSNTSPIKAQLAGNQLYQNLNVDYHRDPVRTSSLRSTDSTVSFTSRVLLNAPAQYYLLSIGLNQVGKTIIGANTEANKRIATIKTKVKSLGIAEKDLFIDFIAQSKLYDHDINNNIIEEHLVGYSIKKNIIIKLQDLTQFDAITNYCSEVGIRDIIKIDYVSQDLSLKNQELFDLAIDLIEKKKKRFQKNSSRELSKHYRIAAEELSIYYPKNLYKQYQEAHESSLNLHYYNNNYIKKEVRKEETFYYDGVETEVGADLIIDRSSPEIGIQYLLELTVVYRLKPIEI